MMQRCPVIPWRKGDIYHPWTHFKRALNFKQDSGEFNPLVKVYHDGAMPHTNYSTAANKYVACKIHGLSRYSCWLFFISELVCLG